MQRDNFAFLRQDHQYHEYYLYILKKEAPHLDWLGDDLVELENWLQDLERQIEKDADASFLQNGQQHQQYQQNGQHDPTGYEEVSEEQFTAELQRQREAEEAQQKAAEEERRRKEAANPPHLPKPGSTTQFLSPDASAQGVGSGMLHGGNTLLQQLMAMAGRTNAAPPPTAATLSSAPPALPPLDGPAASSAASIFGKKKNAAPPPTTATLNSAPPALPPLDGPAASSAASIFGNIPGVAPPPPSAPQEQLSASDLLAIIGGGGGNGSIFGESLPLFNAPPALRAHPLTIPPPPLPSEAVQNRSPSVIVEPLPNAPGMNLPLVLAKALGETLDMKVGPTLIIGDVARIEVPSISVESRAIALKHFYCLGSKLTIIKNDRIIDNPSRVNSSRIMELKERLHGGRGGRGGYAPSAPMDSSFRGRGGRSRGGRGARPSFVEDDTPKQVTSFVPATIGAGYLQPPPRFDQQGQDADAAGRAAGSFTDSDEE
ncbi:Hypothetical protein, putative [Bodo saltans]|uniref:SURP motif domain-containing protein n=1 Tax=Bodo saltans TaxID=75058 RepID=A0A0S4IT53_BODSA|nr:Hypothetical protein, putative [Bodo saltans]|eukprot:CUF74841.1 Hypothetical protein, putative [Bodo saltans]